jgi:hypothetical protein
MSPSRGRIRIYGGLAGAAIAMPIGLLSWMGAPTTLSLAIPAAAAGATIGAWLAPALLGADGVKTAAVGLGAGLIAMPVAGFFIGVGLGAQQILDGDLSGVVYPVAMTLYVPVVFMNLVLVSVPVALIWASVMGRFAHGPRQSALTASRDIPAR